MKLSKLTLSFLLIAALVIGAGGMFVGMTSYSAGTFSLHSKDKSNPKPKTKQKKSPTKNQNKTDSSNPSFGTVQQAYDVISSRYYKNVDKKKLLNGAIRGMVQSLGDRFSVYMDPKTARQFTQSLASSYSGIGAEVSMVNGKVTIMSPFKGSPADQAGLRANDQIISVNGKSVAGLNLYKAVQKIRGKKGTKVTLGVKRQGVSDVMKIDVTRGDIPVHTVHKDTVKKDGNLYGIIEITSFSKGTADEFGTALHALEKNQIDGLVIDVRGNPGGYLGSVTQIGDMIIPNNKPIVQVEDRAGTKKKYFSTLKKKKPYPIVGLLNSGSASAAEILSGALQEAGGYPLVGTTSFGKGTVQTEFNIGKGHLKLTIMKWLTPEGHWINKKGITPNDEIKQPAYYYAQPITVDKGKTLNYNQNGNQIKNAQVMLNGLGFQTGRKDGYFNKQTVSAVRNFQRNNHLSPTGKIDSKTASILDEKVLNALDKKKNDLQLQKALTVLEKEK